MSDLNIAAEIVPVPEHAQSAAKALQQLGFRVLRVDATVSVQAPEQLWDEVFKVSFAKKSKRRFAPSADSSIKYGVPKKESVSIPDSLRDLITDVIFVQPPEFY